MKTITWTKETAGQYRAGVEGLTYRISRVVGRRWGTFFCGHLLSTHATLALAKDRVVRHVNFYHP